MMIKPRFSGLLIIALLCIASVGAIAQSQQQQKTDSVFQLVKKAFNAKNTNSLYALASDGFKKQIDSAAFKNFCDIRFFPLGDIKEASLISFVNNNMATYKVVFSYVTLQLLLSIDENNKFNYFLLQPLSQTTVDKPAPVATNNPLKTLIDKKVDAAARTYIQKINTVGLSIGVFYNGQLSTYGYGETTRQDGKIPNANSIFEIGSITKTFTATLLAYYVNAGKAKLNDPINLYLPDSVASNPALRSVKLINLSNHTSGLPALPDDFNSHITDPTDPYKDYNEKLLFGYLKTCGLNSKPGEKYVYSNLGAALLGLILERISGKTYAQMVADIITRPMQMNSTVMYLTPALKQRFGTVYDEDGKPTTPWHYDAFAPAGAMLSTVNNLMTYARANMGKGNTPLTNAFNLTHQVTFNKDVKIGLNWYVITINGVEYYSHNGGTYGSSSFLAFNTEKNIAVVVLANSGVRVDDVGVGILTQLAAN